MSQYQRAAVKTPVVSIGLPVFNGEGVVEEAIRSVLDQTLESFELIICDNASGDRTAEICRDHASGEPRIRYFRNARNLAPAANYNLAFSHARGRYFKWLAQHDRLLPTYLESTRRVLDERADVVLCNSVVSRIDAMGRRLGVHDSGLAQADVTQAAERFAWMLQGLRSSADFYGLMRTRCLRGSLLYGSFRGAERALLAQVALRGRMAQVPGSLHEMREYPHRPAAWQDAEGAGSSPRLSVRYLKLVQGEALPVRERLRCYSVLARCGAQRWALGRAALAVLTTNSSAAAELLGGAERRGLTGKSARP